MNENRCSDTSARFGAAVFYFSLYSILLIPVRGRDVCSLVNRETLLELGSELRSEVLPANTIDFSGIRTHDSMRANRIF